jgi:phage terminase large subunit
MFEQEYLCSFDAAVYGAIYPKEIARAKAANRVTKVSHVPEQLVYTAWDIGWGDSTSIWFYQLIGGEVRVIDFYENRNEPITHYLERLRSKDYKYDTCWLPHDADNGQLATGKSIADMVRANGFRVQIVPKLSLEDGINAARLLFARCFFDAEKCKHGLDALVNYRWDINKALNELKPTPVHDWSSHAADAFRYLAVTLKANDRPKQKPIRYDGRGIV